MLMQALKLACRVGGKELFRDLDLVVNDGARLGLVGHNGAGKSTLLKLLARAMEPDAGEVIVRRGLEIGSVEQFLPPALATLTLQAAVQANQRTAAPWAAEKLLLSLAFTESEFTLPVSGLSGGQINRLLFARALALEPDLLLLDEPTNHLDIATLTTFEALVANFPGAVVLVSHDRAFLDAVTTTTAFLRDRRAYQFDLPFSAAREALAAQDAAAEQLARAQDKSIAALEASAKRLKTWGKVYDNEALSKRAKSMERRVERLRDERVEVSRGSGLSLDLTLGSSRSKQVLAVDAYSVTVADRLLFEIRELVLRRGERIALLGHNGCGKTTFIRTLIGACRQQLDEPALRVSPQTSVGYYDQELTEVAGPDQTGSLYEFFNAHARLDVQTARTRLIGAGFPYPDHDKPVAVLSGGERARLLFLILAIARPNFLVLDEPTNHIDIQGKEQLEEQLVASDATLLITSHDRRFIERVANRFLLIDRGRLLEVTRPDAFFAERRAPELPATVSAGLSSLDSNSATEAAASPAASAAASASPSAFPSAFPSASAADVPAVLGAAEEESLLARLLALEALLAADRQRKAKHQKPALQAAWAAEIDELNSRLG